MCIYLTSWTGHKVVVESQGSSRTWLWRLSFEFYYGLTCVNRVDHQVSLDQFHKQGHICRSKWCIECSVAWQVQLRHESAWVQSCSRNRDTMRCPSAYQTREKCEIPSDIAISAMLVIRHYLWHTVTYTLPHPWNQCAYQTTLSPLGWLSSLSD